jgi:hypothetical protein
MIKKTFSMAKQIYIIFSVLLFAIWMDGYSRSGTSLVGDLITIGILVFLVVLYRIIFRNSK